MTNFIRKIAPYAVEHGGRAGVLPSLIIAQGILESAHGTSELAVNARNLFGVKAGIGWQGAVYRKKTAEYVNGKRIEDMAEFRAYPTYEGAVIDLVAKYTGMARYAAVPFSRDYKAATQAVFASGYATDPKYPVKLMRIIEQYGLTKYDEGVAKRMVSIKKQLVTSRASVSAGTNTREYITIHETANTSRGANAQSHANLQSRGNSRNASWHYQVDDKEAIQSFDDTAICWHAGSGTGNKRSIGIEICVNSDGNFAQAVKNAAELTAYLMRKHGIPLSRVVQHRHWSGKNCPTNLINGRKGINWPQFQAMVSGGSGAVHASAPAPSQEMDYGDYLYGQTIMEGMGGAAAKRMQGDLTKLGYPLASDGSVGPATVAAIRAFQKAHGLTVDGIAGKETQAKIREALADLNKPKPAPKPKAPEVAQVSAKVRNEPLPSHAEGWAWAEAMGLMNGERPADTLSREQFATVLKRFYDLLYGWDRAVSATHAEAFAKAERAGIIKGGRPAAVVSREQMATILDRIGALDK